MPPMTGRVIAGRYNLVELIGRGAMGVVWRARDSLLDRDVAIKEVLLNGAIAIEDRENAYRRTMREARTAARLSHRGVVTIYDVAEEDGRPWIIMELIPGRSLDQILGSDGKLPPRRACRVGQQLLAALAAAHSAAVLHRDVKPSNVLIAEEPDGDRAVLTDFGIAQFAGDPRLTQTGMVMGSPGFTAPERIRGGIATPASDLWSLGATLFAAVEGRGPYEERGGAITTMSAIINEDAPPASSAGPLAPLIGALLRRDPVNRPTAAAAARMFASVLPMLPELPPPARRTPALLQSVIPAPSPASATSRDALPAAPEPPEAPEAPEDGAVAGTAEDAAPEGTLAPDDAASAAPDATPAAPDNAGTAAPGEAGTAAPDAASATPDDAAAGAEGADVASDARGASGQPPDGGQEEGEPAQGGTPPAEVADDDAATPRTEEMPRAAEPETAADTPESREPAPSESRQPAPSESHEPVPAESDEPAPPAGPSAPDAPKAGAALAPWPVMDSTATGTRSPGSSDHRDDPPTKPQPFLGPAPAPSPLTRRRRRGPQVAAAVVAVVLAVVIGVAVALVTRHGASAGDSTSDTAAASSRNLPDAVKAIDGPPAAVPAGWSTETVTPAENGTAGGFSIGVPPAWTVRHKKFATYLDAPGGMRYLDIDLTKHDRSDMLAEAKYIERNAVAEQHLPGYQRVSLQRVDIRGTSGVFWAFGWAPPGGVAMRVDDLLFDLPTPVGSQSYAVYFTSPAAGSATNPEMPLFNRILRTFRPLPG